MGLFNDWRRFTLCRANHRGNAGYPGLFPMIGGFFTTIPSAVLGGQ